MGVMEVVVFRFHPPELDAMLKDLAERDEAEFVKAWPSIPLSERVAFVESHWSQYEVAERQLIEQWYSEHPNSRRDPAPENEPSP